MHNVKCAMYNELNNIELVEMGQTCSTYGRFEKCIGRTVLVQKTERKKPLGKTRRRGENVN